MHSKHDARETTAAARAAFLARFEAEVDPEGTLPLDERQRRAEHARSAYFTRLALAAAKARRQNRDGTVIHIANEDMQELAEEVSRKQLHRFLDGDDATSGGGPDVA